MRKQTPCRLRRMGILSPVTERSPALRAPTEADYEVLIRVLDAWWGRRVSSLLPRLFFQHFGPTSWVVELDRQPVAFLIGFISETDPSLGYVHFVGVDPGHRRLGLGRLLYERFFETVGPMGVRRVKAVTSPINTRSIAFHRSIGFSVSAVQDDYDGPGEDRVILERSL
jgi:ribosomal protein S18 acetylase RimI-like enzyme